MTRSDTPVPMQRLGLVAPRFGFGVLIVAARGDHVVRASAALRPFAGAGRPCAFTTALPEPRGRDLRDGPARGIDGTAAVALAGPL
jgi:hypothetical protein